MLHLTRGLCPVCGSTIMKLWGRFHNFVEADGFPT